MLIAFFRHEHPDKAIAYMLDVMNSIVEEAGQLPQGVLDAILQPLLPSSKKESPAAHKLASKLVQRSSVRLQGPIAQFISDALVSTRATSSELKGESHELLIELVSLVPALLKDVLPVLELELKVRAAFEAVPIRLRNDARFFFFF